MAILSNNNLPSGSCTSNGVTIVVDASGDGKVGTGDGDTISVDADYLSVGELAVVINHEYQHVVNRNGAVTDPTTNHNTPSGFCNHVAMAQQDLELMCYLSYEGVTIPCASMQEQLASVNIGILRCIEMGGTYCCENPSADSCNCT